MFMIPNWVSVHFSKNDVISSVRKHYCVLGFGFGLGLAKIRFRSNVFSSKCSRFTKLYPFMALCLVIDRLKRMLFELLTFILFCTSFAEDWRYHETIHCTEIYSFKFIPRYLSKTNDLWLRIR